MAFAFFEELTGFPTYDIGVDRQSSTREGKIPWNQLDNLIAELFPFGSLVTSAHPNFPVMHAKSLHIEPFANKNEPPTAPISSNLALSATNEYLSARVRIEYEVSPGFTEEEEQQDPEENQDPINLLTHRWSIGGEFLTVPASGFEWSDAEPIDDNKIDIGKLVPTIEHQITWPRVQSPPFQAIRDTIGKCNSGPGSFKTGTILPETLLFLGAELSRDILSTGFLAWEVSYRFSERRVTSASGTDGVTGDLTKGGWNHFMRADDSFWTASPAVGFYRVQGKTGHTGAGDDVFEQADFLPLFVEGA